MRQIGLYGILIACMFACNNGDGNVTQQTSGGDMNLTGENMPVIMFDTLVNDLGTLIEGEQLVAWFEYTNTGSAPLVIQDIKAGCGCTVPRWNDEPLAPGDSGSIRVVFDSAGKSGAQRIRITVQTNAADAREELYLKAMVESKL